MELWLLFSAAGVFVFGVIVYVAFMIFLPEWVGITGKTALENERSHRDGKLHEDNDFLSRLHEKKTSDTAVPSSTQDHSIKKSDD